MVANHWLSPGDELDLPAGSFGYSLQFENDHTGIELARGGKGNENGLWIGNAGPQRCPSGDWAGMFFKLSADLRGQAKIAVDRISPSRPSRAGDIRSSTEGQGVAIAVCDTGIDVQHPALGEGRPLNDKVLGGYDFVDDDAIPDPQGLSHGTLCAVIAAGKPVPKASFAGGVAPQAKLYSLKICGPSRGKAQYDHLLRAILWCVEHRDLDPAHPILVVCVAQGGGRSFAPADAVCPALTGAVRQAEKAGICVLVASGNDGWRDSLRYPATISSVLAVGACKGQMDAFVSARTRANPNPAKAVADYSNVSPLIGIVAPGRCGLVSSLRRITGRQTENGAASASGTSYACAFAAGAVACLQSAAKVSLGRYLTPSEVRERLLASADWLDCEGRPYPQVNLSRALSTLDQRCPAFLFRNEGNADLVVWNVITKPPDRSIVCMPSRPFTVEPGQSRSLYISVADDVTSGTYGLEFTSNAASPVPHMDINVADPQEHIRGSGSTLKTIFTCP